MIGIEEKPKKPKSSFAVRDSISTTTRWFDIASGLGPSTSRRTGKSATLNNVYLKRGELQLELLGRGFAWLDTGTPESLLEACNSIETIERRQGLKVGCVEEIAYRMGSSVRMPCGLWQNRCEKMTTASTS